MTIDDLLSDFDEMGFAPVTLCENPEEYACEWKKQLIAEIERLKAENEFLNRTDEEIYKEVEDNIRAEIANSGTSCHWCENIIRKKAVKEFAEKLKSEMLDREYNGIHYKWGAFSDNDIDELLKEYEE